MFKLIKKFSEKTLTHTGPVKMVNIGTKQDSLRYARASCIINVSEELINLIKNNNIAKGDVLRTAEIAGIMGAKKTSDLIPLCHQLNLNSVSIKIEISDKTIIIESYAECYDKTGVEIEAMMGVNIAALTVYDMCKAVDKGIIINEIKLIEKYGGKSGHFKI